MVESYKVSTNSVMSYEVKLKVARTLLLAGSNVALGDC